MKASTYWWPERDRLRYRALAALVDAINALPVRRYRDQYQRSQYLHEMVQLERKNTR